MGDAYSHMYRDQRRAAAVREWHDKLHAYLLNPTDSRSLDAQYAAEAADAISGHGYFSGPTALAAGVVTTLLALREGHEGTWRDFLLRLTGDESGRGWEEFRRFKALSPFRQKILVFVAACPDAGTMRLVADPEQFISPEELRRDHEARGKGERDTSVHMVEIDVLDGRTRRLSAIK